MLEQTHQEPCRQSRGKSRCEVEDYRFNNFFAFRIRPGRRTKKLVPRAAKMLQNGATKTKPSPGYFTLGCKLPSAFSERAGLETD